MRPELTRQSNDRMAALSSSISQPLVFPISALWKTNPKPLSRRAARRRRDSSNSNSSNSSHGNSSWRGRNKREKMIWKRREEWNAFKEPLSVVSCHCHRRHRFCTMRKLVTMDLFYVHFSGQRYHFSSKYLKYRNGQFYHCTRPDTRLP